MGIFFRDASGSVKNVATRNQLLDASVSCPDGYGIAAESGGATMAVSFVGNSVRLYQTQGIVVRDHGTTGTIKGNSVVGRGADITDFFQNGIEMAFGATGTISGNFVTDNAAPAATGILCNACHDVEIIGNVVGNGGNGIANFSDSTLGDADGTTIASNVIFGAGNPTPLILDPSLYICSNNTAVHDNQISGSRWAAIQVDNSCLTIASGAGNNNIFKDNRINEACAAFLLTPGVTGNVLKDNDYFNVLQKVKTGSTCP
jgi:Right handed beta helix region